MSGWEKIPVSLKLWILVLASERELVAYYSQFWAPLQSCSDVTHVTRIRCLSQLYNVQSNSPPPPSYISDVYNTISANQENAPKCTLTHVSAISAISYLQTSGQKNQQVMLETHARTHAPVLARTLPKVIGRFFVCAVLTGSLFTKTMKFS